MDYYSPNFNLLWWQEMGENDAFNNISLTKANTHYEHTVFENPENTVFSLISAD